MRRAARVALAALLLAVALPSAWQLAATPSAVPDPVQAAFPACSSVRFMVNPGPAGPDFVAEARAAFARLSRVTGLRFVYAGTSSEVPSSRYLGDGSAPVLVGWVSPSGTDLLLPGASGGTSLAVVRGTAVSGAVALNAEHLRLYRPGFGPGMSSGSLLLHELGHLAGLPHSQEPGSLMADRISPDGPGGFTRGDRDLLAGIYAPC